ncbi:MAG: family hydrolase [Rickettsiaceae bacterium]|jgi:HAD superfamily hydrolase (TIGR01459 family)|nr:family hydrolase [Rickettsiaceae bacterium]
MIYNFNDIYQNYDLFFIDVWGVVHDGYKPYPGTVDRLNKLLEEKKLFFVSNAPRPNYIVSQKLKEHGIKINDSHVITSGDVTRTHLSELGKEGKIIYHLGETTNTDILKDIDIKVTSNLEEADFLLLSIFLNEGASLEQFDSLFEQAVNLNIPVLCANPDKKIVKGAAGDSFVYCAGYFAEKIEAMGGEVHYFGKPHKNIYDFAIQQARIETSLDKILMIGDTIYTDVLGANQAKIHSALVLTGNSEAHLKEIIEKEAKISKLKEIFDSYKVEPNWVIKGLF